jgi:hypothetical protein
LTAKSNLEKGVIDTQYERDCAFTLFASRMLNHSEAWLERKRGRRRRL